ncbi:MAG: winged helix-turn-helix transcriptional regulator, partial [Methanomicrobia archaeon]|nr:winged helix-turn-helix transcriptional regulator [Methanomicrobia archaeon]
MGEQEGENVEEILSLLEENARISNAEIARMTGLEEADVKAIIADLERKGIVKKYKAIVNYAKAGIETVQALIDVNVCPERDTGYDAIAERISRFP